ncbi:MAG: dihydrofolate reductase [Herbiconiux sp.]|nr:dihydrofolate reductase [Herbiconiux sp.]
MRTLTYYVAVSLDGRIAAADGDYSAFPTEGDHLDALAAEFPETFPVPARAALGLTDRGTRFDTVLMGWDTYAVGLPFGLVAPYALRTVVFTRDPARRRAEARDAAPAETPDAADAVTFTDGDPATVVRRLKEEVPAGDAGGADTPESARRGLWLCGGGSLAAALLPEIDRLVLKVNPVLLGGAGIPLFAGGVEEAGAGFRLESSRSFRSGVVISEYPRAEQEE